jgi:phytoene dehydrogenase-like protein
MLAMTASYGGFAVPRGGAGAITRALVTRLEQAGGSISCGTRVARIIVRDGRAAAIVTDGGEEIAARHAVLADTSAPALFLRLLPEAHVPTPVADAMRRFRRGFGTFKMDWALSAPVPWSAAPAREAAVVHTGEDNDDLARFAAEVRSGVLPRDPYLVIGQQSLLDPTRAPAGRQTLWAYSRVPNGRVVPIDHDTAERFADRIEHRIEELAPGFRQSILARKIFAPRDLEALDANLEGGDLGGGTADISNQLFLRPMFPYFRYRTPVRGLYLASSYAHPGAGVHGMCGFNAANAALDDLASRSPRA